MRQPLVETAVDSYSRFSGTRTSVSIKALQARHDQTMLLVGSDDDMSIELAAIGLRSVDHDDVAVMNQRHHGAAVNSQATGIGWVGTPLAGRRQHRLRRDLMESFRRVSLASMRRRYDGQNGDSYEFVRPLEGTVRAGLDHLQLQHPILAQTGANRGQNSH